MTTSKQTAADEAKAWQQSKIRRLVWMCIRDVGSLPVAAIVIRTGLDEKAVATACGELRECSNLTCVPHEDGRMRYCVTAMPFHEERINRHLAKLAEQHEAQ